MSFSCVRTLRFFFAAGVCSVVLATGVDGQEATYVGCETVAGAIDFVEVRDLIREEYPDNPTFVGRVVDLYVADYSEACSHRGGRLSRAEDELQVVDWHRGRDFEGVNGETILCHVIEVENGLRCVYTARSEVR